MKSLVFILSCFLGTSYVQLSLNEDDFASRFRQLFESAAKRFTDEKAGEKRSIDEEGFKAAYGTVSTFSDAYSSRLLIDSDDILTYEAIFRAGISKEEAKAYLEKVTGLIKKNIPAGFVVSSTYEMNWADPLIYAVEYDSDVFAEQAKRPSAKAGIVSSENNFFIRLLISEPVFK